MKIALDLDGVIANLQSVNLQRATLDSGKLIFSEDFTTYDALRRITGNKDYFNHYYLNIWKEFSDHITPLERDVDVVSRMLSRCGEVDIVTSHNEDDRLYISRWLRDYGVSYDNLVLHGFYKTKEDIQYDVIIDDSPTLPQRLLSVNNPAQLYVYDQLYNRDAVGKYHRVRTLREVYRDIYLQYMF